jgi:hypothetical protein
MTIHRIVSPSVPSDPTTIIERHDALLAMPGAEDKF